MIKKSIFLDHHESRSHSRFQYQTKPNLTSSGELIPLKPKGRGKESVAQQNNRKRTEGLKNWCDPDHLKNRIEEVKGLSCVFDKPRTRVHLLLHFMGKMPKKTGDSKY